MMLAKVKKLDYLEALFEINEFWSDLQAPTFMPYEFQGIGNKLSPKEFYTKEHLKEVIMRHEAWLIEKKPIISN
ncbi:hypothetical protein FACS1894192_09360 [Bacilli bacterium]|nr:hypothetical protein FACS1894192_09360 [Bacilli bacterium]